MQHAQPRSESPTSVRGPASWSLDLATGELRSSPVRARMMGFDPAAVIATAQWWDRTVHPDDRAALQLARTRHLQDGGSGYRSEYRAQRQDGEWIRLLEIGCIERDANGSPLRVEGVLLDVTLEQDAQQLDMLVAGVAHEINTPVQFVSDSIHFVRDGLYELLALTDRLRALAARDQCNVNSVAALSTHLPYLVDNLPKALERSLEGLKRVSEIVGSMRELAHPDSPEMSDTDINHIIQNALVVARSEYKHVADVSTDLMPLPPVRCHAGELNQVILNLVVNASHAIAELVGDSGRKGTIEVSSRREGDRVRISVSDTGAGIPDAIRHRVFEPYFTTKDVGRGTGQGLAISHNIIVQRHGGAIDFESVVGKGTVFHLRLPCASPLERVA